MKAEEERVLLIVLTHIYFVCCLGLGLETSLQVCARPPGLYRKSYSGPKIFDRSVCLYVPVSKVHHRNTIAPFFMMMCVRRTETSKDSEKLVTTLLRHCLEPTINTEILGLLPLVQLALCAHKQLSGERNTCT